ncbi:hypothetical protein [Cupriavidus sp. BIC8F]|uniref:hypothetical protein n=1 Tax=Cupriavidus sp. BIC8F TaxID=3079014 RepID=UPI0029168A42|nr:hypothetical protein [Cupriavidus sp. BIC8F]
MTTSKARVQLELDMFEAVVNGSTYDQVGKQYLLPPWRVRATVSRILREIWRQMNKADRPAVENPYKRLPPLEALWAHASIWLPEVHNLRQGKKKAPTPIHLPAPDLTPAIDWLSDAVDGQMDSMEAYRLACVPVFLSLLHGTSLTQTAESIGQSKLLVRRLATLAAKELLGDAAAAELGWRVEDSQRLQPLREQFLEPLRARGWTIAGNQWMQETADSTEGETTPC